MGRLRRAAGAKYLLRDTFDDARAAGAVNGTLATDGKNTRTVVDTNSKISTTNGVLDFATGAVNLDGVWYESLARGAGKVLQTQLTLADATSVSRVGWATAMSGAITDRLTFSVGTLYVQASGEASGVALGTYAADTFDIAVAMRAAGFFWLLKGGTYATWTLMRVTSAGTAAGIPVLQTGSGTTIFTVPEISIPSTLWLPTPLLSDGFGSAGALTVSDGLGHAEGIAGGLGAGGVATWTAQIGTWANAAGVCAAATLVGGIAIATAPTGQADVLHSAEVTRSAGDVGIVVRYVDADNYIYAIHDGTNAQLIKRVATAETTLINAAAAYAAGAMLQVITDGTSVDLFYNNKKIGTTQTIADGALQTSTAHGLYTDNTGNTFDDAVCYKRKGYTDIPGG